MNHPTLYPILQMANLLGKRVNPDLDLDEADPTESAQPASSTTAKRPQDQANQSSQREKADSTEEAPIQDAPPKSKSKSAKKSKKKKKKASTSAGGTEGAPLTVDCTPSYASLGDSHRSSQREERDGDQSKRGSSKGSPKGTTQGIPASSDTNQDAPRLTEMLIRRG